MAGRLVAKVVMAVELDSFPGHSHLPLQCSMHNGKGRLWDPHYS